MVTDSSRRYADLQSGALSGATTSDAKGNFSFTGVNPAVYVVEIVDEAGAIAGTSAAVAVTADFTVTVSVSTSSAAAAPCGAMPAAITAADGGLSPAVVIATAGAVAGITAVIVAATQSEASPSR
jgi:hypothetical protein